MRYATKTYENQNPLRRFAHRARFDLALRLARGDVLDYGAGDGHFMDMLRGRPGVSRVAGFDPRATSSSIARRIEDVTASFDTVTCLEVMEHLTDAEQATALRNMARLLRPGGKAIISVPVMIGPAGFLKLCMPLRSERPGHTFANALRCLVARPPAQRWTNPSGFYYHLGFDHRKLQRTLERHFARVEAEACPFGWLPYWLNSQMFYVCHEPTSSA